MKKYDLVTEKTVAALQARLEQWDNKGYDATVVVPVREGYFIILKQRQRTITQAGFLPAV